MASRQSIAAIESAGLSWEAWENLGGKGRGGFEKFALAARLGLSPADITTYLARKREGYYAGGRYEN
jgi:hypothetical protein